MAQELTRGHALDDGADGREFRKATRIDHAPAPCTHPRHAVACDGCTRTDLTFEVVVVIVNYKTPGLVIKLLQTLRASKPGPMGVVVVDNASPDASLDVLKRYRNDLGDAEWLHIEASPRNRGFAGGNNLGMACARRVWPRVAAYFLLNPDTQIESDAVCELARFLQQHERVGVVGSQVVNPEGRAESSGHRGDGPITQLLAAARPRVLERLFRSRVAGLAGAAQPVQCDWVSGAALMIRRSTLEQVGPMDEGFFLYFEEMDLCRRVRIGGWQVWLVPQSRVCHWEGSSTGISTGRRPAYWFASRRRYFLKHFGILGLMAADAAWLTSFTLLQTRHVLGSSAKRRLPPHFARDLLLGDVSAVLTGGAHGG